MKLTKARRRFLEIYRGYRKNPPTVWSLIRTNWLPYALLFVGFSLMFVPLYLMSVAFDSWVGCYIWSGAVLGALIRDVGWLARICRNWPLSEWMIDWNRVDEMLDAPPRATPITPP